MAGKKKTARRARVEKWRLRGGTFTWKLPHWFSEESEHKRDSGSSSSSSKCHLVFQHGEGFGV